MSDQAYDRILREMQQRTAQQPHLGVLTAQIIQLMKEKNLSTELAFKELHAQLLAELAKREPLIEELRRLAAIKDPDPATLKRIDEIIELVEGS